jgi:hypothetical protein
MKAEQPLQPLPPKESIMAKNKNTKFKGTANPEYIAAMRELRSSSAAGTHDNRPKRERSRSAAKKVSITRGW